MRVHSANRAFYQTFHVSREETEHHLIDELGNGQWDIPGLRRLLEDVVPKSSVFNDFELMHQVRDLLVGWAVTTERQGSPVVTEIEVSAKASSHV